MDFDAFKESIRNVVKTVLAEDGKFCWGGNFYIYSRSPGKPPIAACPLGWYVYKTHSRCQSGGDVIRTVQHDFNMSEEEVWQFINAYDNNSCFDLEMRKFGEELFEMVKGHRTL